MPQNGYIINWRLKKEGKDMKKVLVPLAPGFEEIEALTVVDILRRAGAKVTVAGTVSGAIEGRSGIKVLPDALMDNADDGYDMIVLPGGAVGAENLRKDARVRKAIESLAEKGKSVAAICAAPTVLSAIGVTRGRVITSHPSVRGMFSEESLSDERVVVDGNIITSQSPGTAMEFAFVLVETLFGKEKAVEVNKGVLARL
jgi:4-methyl-5(b-hydroxyethyl)-thiazole monophosphate biosynthesis